jgi:hypothetical protein
VLLCQPNEYASHALPNLVRPSTVKARRLSRFATLGPVAGCLTAPTPRSLRLDPESIVVDAVAFDCRMWRERGRLRKAYVRRRELAAVRAACEDLDHLDWEGKRLALEALGVVVVAAGPMRKNQGRHGPEWRLDVNLPLPEGGVSQPPGAIR